MTARSGSIVAAVWLIGIGLVFLIRDWMNLGWGDAWPLFVILVGIAAAVSTLIGRRAAVVRAWDLLWPLAWIALGVVLLLSTTGRLDASPGELISNGWPIVLIGIGLWLLGSSFVHARAATQTLSLPLPAVDAARVRLAFGGGSLQVERAPDGVLAAGTFSSGVSVKERGPGDVELSPETSGGAWLPWDGTLDWRVGLTGEVPLDLRVDGGAYRGSLDLTELLLRSLEIRTGASDTRVMLPRAAGMTTVRAESGAASTTLTVPDGVAARVRSKMSLGSVSVDESRFPRAADGWASPDYETAANKVEITIEGGVGSVRVA
jgi:hypothetical protein